MSRCTNELYFQLCRLDQELIITFRRAVNELQHTRSLIQKSLLINFRVLARMSYAFLEEDLEEFEIPF